MMDAYVRYARPSTLALSEMKWQRKSRRLSNVFVCTVVVVVVVVFYPLFSGRKRVGKTDERRAHVNYNSVALLPYLMCHTGGLVDWQTGG